MDASQAARLLGVSRRKMYALAAPSGPVPCYRIGGRVVFEEDDILDYKASCRSIAARKTVASSLSSTVTLKAGESALRKSFLALGIKPKPTLSTVKSRPASMH
ncbi:helix-turn-helix domain-containing protein [Ottowia sp.]|uniref:helix-turn-helix domain-containing protein n=1 Tax=Ottowia sp. TaxID=1898956 RepID=UPI003C76B4A5